MDARLIDFMGDDLRVVNVARQSNAKLWKRDFDLDRDARLIGFLARGMQSSDFDAFVDAISEADDREVVRSALLKFRRTGEHWTPFGHVCLSVQFSAPISVARQFFKHRIGLRSIEDEDGIEAGDNVENEVSRRYVHEDPEVYKPAVWRKRAPTKKQGSLDEGVENEPSIRLDYEWAVDACLQVYRKMIEAGVAPEQARFVLPQATMTTWTWTGTLAAFARVYCLRAASDAQWESRLLARLMEAEIETVAPVSWAALTEGGAMLTLAQSVVVVATLCQTVPPNVGCRIETVELFDATLTQCVKSSWAIQRALRERLVPGEIVQNWRCVWTEDAFGEGG